MERLEDRTLLSALTIDPVSGAPGETVTATVEVDDATGIEGFHFEIGFDASIASISSAAAVRAGSLFAGGEVVANVNEPGRLIVAGAIAPGLAGGSGSLLEIDFTIDAAAGLGTVSPLDFEAATLNDGGLTVDPLPVDGADPSDGTLTVQSSSTGGLGDFVWNDLDGDGVQDAGEPGVQDVTVNLLDAGGAPTGQSTTTDGDGLYAFSGLAAGDYAVEFELPAGFAFTTADQGGDDALDSDADPATGRSPVVTVAAGETNATVDAGLRELPPPGFAVDPGNGVTVGESGSTDAFSVVLTSQPTSDVVLTVTSGDTGEATASPATLTFTPSNWDQPQTVTVTGVHDDLDDGDQVTAITVSVDDANSDDAFDGLADQTVNATTTDDDQAGFTVVESGGSTVVSESGTSDTFTVVLDAQPTSDVVLHVLSADTGEATVSPGTLTFTPSNWDAPQVVTVTGVADDVDDGDQTVGISVLVDDADSDDAFDGVPDVLFTATATDVPATLERQIVAPTIASQQATVGSSFSFGVEYTTDPLDETLTGLGLRLHFDSSRVQFDGLSDVLQTSLFLDATVDDDVSDFDSDSRTDKYVRVAWSDFAGNWPGTLPAELYTANFTALSSPGTAVFNFTASSTAGTFELDATSATVDVVEFDIDVDANGEADALTDGVLIVRHLFGATGSQLTDGALGPGATRTDPAEVAAYVAGNAAFLDVDANGETDALTDGVLVVRHLFGATGTQLTDGALGPGATRTDPVGVAEYLQGLLPQATASDELAAANESPERQIVTPTLVPPSTVPGSSFSFDVDYTTDPLDETLTGLGLLLHFDSSLVQFDGLSNVLQTSLFLDATVDDDVSDFDFDSDSRTDKYVRVAWSDFAGNWPGTLPAELYTANFTALSTPGTAVFNFTDSSTAGTFELDATSATVVIEAATPPGFTVAESDGATSVSESGTSNTFTVVLDAEPASNVVLNVTSGDTGEAAVNPATLTFTPSNWDQPQTVTVSGVDDDVDDGDQVTAITVSVDDASSDDAFDALADQIVNATTADDDQAGFTVDDGDGVAVSESGTSDTFSVVLDAEPASNVVLNVSSGDTGEAAVNPATLTFTPSNWDQPQTVTVSGVDDDLDDGNQVTAITVSVDEANSDDAFDGLADQTVNATTTDDDQAGFTIDDGDGVAVSESGTSDTFTVVLDAEPASNVVLNVASDDTGEATVSPATLTFTPANWDQPQTVTVSGVDDDLDDGDQVTAITVSVDDANSDDAFDALVDQIVNATTADDDAPGFTIDDGDGVAVSESGTSDTFTVVLDAEPASNVVLNVASGDTGEATVNPASLTFTPANWDQPQTVTVTGVDDDLDDGNQVTAITVSVDDANSDDAFDGLADQSVNATTTDDEIVSTIDVRLVAVPSLTPADSVGALPTGLDSILVGQSYVVEVWVQDRKPETEGIAAVSVDVGYETDVVDVANLAHGAFDQFVQGTIDDGNELVDDLSGVFVRDNPDDPPGAGIAPSFARIGSFEVDATAAGQAVFDVSAGGLDFSRANVVGAVDPAEIDFGSTLTVEQIAAEARLDLRVRLAPAGAGDGLNETTGEIAELPQNATSLHEWQSFVVEVYGSTPSTTDLDVQTSLFTLGYDSAFFTATGVEPGPAFALGASAVDDAAGTVNVAVAAEEADLGDDAAVLLARVSFESLGEDGVPMDFESRDFGPFDLGLNVDGTVTVETAGSLTPEIGAPPATELFPVTLDTDDNGRINFGDVGPFVGVFLETVDAPASIPADPGADANSAFEIPADLNGDGIVNFGDMTSFVLNFLAERGDDLTLPTGYADGLRRGREWFGGASASALGGSSAESTASLSAASTSGDLTAQTTNFFDAHEFDSSGNFHALNQFPSSPTQLGSRVGTSTLSNLTIYTAGDVDHYRFQMLATGEFGDDITLSTGFFNNGQSHGNAEIALLRNVSGFPLQVWDATGQRSSGTASISLAGFAPGDYLVRVRDVSGLAGVTGNYSLQFDAPFAVLADNAEPNNIPEFATGLGSIDGAAESLTGLTIHAGTDVDYFTFELPSLPGINSVVRVEYNGSLNRNLQLQVFDPFGNPVASFDEPDPFGLGRVEFAPLLGRAAGVYTARVFDASGHTHSQYNLTIVPADPDVFEPNDLQFGQFPTDLTDETVFSQPGLSLHTLVDQDWFAVRLLAQAELEHFVGIDLNGDFSGKPAVAVYDAHANLVRGWWGGLSGSGSTVTVPLAGLHEGVYFVRVLDLDNFAHSLYDLHLNLPNPVGDAHEPNDEIASATPLDLSGGPVELSDLSLHTRRDQDLFAFELTSTGSPRDFVTATSRERLGNLDLVLYRRDVASGLYVPAAWSLGPTNNEFISLNGAPAGEYLLQATTTATFTTDELEGLQTLYGSVVPSYTLTVAGPQAALVRDAHDQPGSENDSPGDATDLGNPLTGRHVVPTLSLHDADDEDYFAFTLDEAPGHGHSVRLDFNHAAGDVDLAVTGPDGTTRTSRGLTDREEVSLRGMGAGTYLVHVTGSPSPLYNLTVVAPGTSSDSERDEFDEADPNDTAANATDLGELTGPHAFRELSIHDADDVDWFRFQTTATAGPGTFATIGFDAAAGELDLFLYDASDPSTAIRSSTIAGSVERIDLAGLPADEYLLKVVGFDRGKGRESNPLYFLGLALPGPDAHDANPDRPGNEFENARSLVADGNFGHFSIDESGDVDWFAFHLPTTGRADSAVALSFLHRDGDLDLELFAAPDEGDPLGDPLLVSKTARDGESIPLAGLPAGDYLVRVSGHAGATNAQYTIVVDVPDALAEADGTVSGFVPDWSESAGGNESAGTAVPLPTIGGLFTTTDSNPLSLHDGDDEDWFGVTLTATGTADHFASIAFDGRQGELNLEVLDETGGALPGVETSVVRRGEFGSDARVVSLAGVPAGTYRIRVWGDANPDYRLGLSVPADPAPDFAEGVGGNDGPDADNATDLKEVFGPLVVNPREPLSLHDADDVDFFAFEITTPGRHGHTASIQFDHRLGNLDLFLLDETGNDVLDESTTFTNREIVSLDGLPAGRYLLKVASGENDGGAIGNPAYRLAFLAPPSADGDRVDRVTPNDTEADAYFLGTVSTPLPVGTFSIHDADDVDWFRFQTTSPGTAEDEVFVIFDRDAGDLDLRVHAPDGSVIESTTNQGVERVSLEGLPAGEFLVQVLGHDQATNPEYTLLVDGPSERPDDPTETLSGEVIRDLRTVEGSQPYGPFSIHEPGDVDEFRFELAEDGAAGHLVAIDFDHSQGDLELELFNASGGSEGLASSTTNFEAISLDGLSAGVYTVEVGGVNGATSPSYTLLVDAPHARDAAGNFAPDRIDRLTPNDSRGDAFDLNVVEGPRTTGPHSVHSTADVDWFRFELAREAVPGNVVRVDLQPSEGTAEVELVRLVNSVEESLATRATNAHGFAEIDLRQLGLAAGEFFVRVDGAGNTRVPEYQLTIVGSPAPSRDESEILDAAAGSGELAASNFSGLVHPPWDLGGLQSSNDYFRSPLLDLILGRNGGGGLDVGLSPGPAPTNFTTDPVLTTFNGGGMFNLPTGEPTAAARGLTFSAGQGGPQIHRGFQSLFGPDFLPQQTALLSGNLTGNQSNAFLGKFLPGGTSGFLDGFLQNNSLVGGLVDAVGLSGFTSFLPGGSGLAGGGGLGGALAATNSLFPTDQSVANSPWARDITNHYRQSVGLPPVRDMFGSGGYTPPPQGNPLGGFVSGLLGQSNQILQNGLHSSAFFRGLLGSPSAGGVMGMPGSLFAPPSQFASAAGELSASATQTDDEDAFEFELVSEGRVGQFVTVTFDNDLGNVDLELLDAAGTRIAVSDGTGDAERISLAGLPAGTYFARIFGEDNPHYAFLADVLAQPERDGDFAEPNETLETPYDLRVVEGVETRSDLSVHRSGDVDWFAFETTAAGGTGHGVRIDFNHALGDLDLALYDESGNRLRADEGVGTGDRETVSLEGLPAGRYLLQVLGHAGATNPVYDLTIIAPTVDPPEPDDLENNNLPSEASVLHPDEFNGHRRNLTITEGDVDWFEFTIAGEATAAHEIQVEFERSRGDLVVGLHTPDGSETPPITRTGVANASGVLIPLDGLPAGTYLLRVSGATADTANDYALHLDAPLDGDPALDAWTVMVVAADADLDEPSQRLLNLLESAAGRVPDEINFAFLRHGASAGELERGFVVADGDRAESITPFETVAAADTPRESVADFVSWATSEAPAERTAVIVWGAGLGTHGVELGGARLSYPNLFGALGDATTGVDVVVLETGASATAGIAHSAAAVTDLLVASPTTIGDELLPYDVAFDALAGDDTPTATDLTAALVQSHEAAHQRPGTANALSVLRTDRTTALHSALQSFVTSVFANATTADLDALRDARDATPAIGGAASVRDLGQFLNAIDANVSSEIDTAITGLSLALDELVAVRPDLGVGGLGMALPEHGASANDVHFGDFAAFLGPETRWGRLLELLEYGPTARVAPAPRADWADGNHVPSRAFDLDTLAGPGHVFGDLSLHTPIDVDWFRVTFTATGSASDGVTATTADGSTVALALFEDPFADPVAEVIGSAPAVSLDGLAPGEFFVRITSAADTAEYELRIDAPGTALDADPTTDNQTREKARDLGTIAADARLSGLALAPVPAGLPSLVDNADGEAWFRFETSRSESERLAITVATTDDSATSAVPLLLELLDADGQPVRPGVTGTGALTIDFAPEPATEYFVRLSRTATGSELGALSESDPVRFQLGVQTAVPPERVVPAIATTAEGVSLSFVDAIDVFALNVTTTEADGASDVSLVGTAGGPVDGSLVVLPDGRNLRFVPTGGPLPPDDYTFSLRSGTGGVRAASSGEPLDGDDDGTPGGDLVHHFSVLPDETRVLRLPDVVRGPGQTIDVAFTAGGTRHESGAGVPLVLSDGDGVTSASFTLEFPPGLATVADVLHGADLPAGSTVTTTPLVPGAVRVTVTASEPLPAGPVELVRLSASIRESAPTGVTAAWEVSGLTLNGGAIAGIGDAGVLGVGLLGDTTADGTYGALDAQRVLRKVVGLDAGFAAWPLLDPALVGDVTGDGVVGALDASRLLAEVVGLDPDDIPPTAGATGTTTLLASGTTADPSDDQTTLEDWSTAPLVSTSVETTFSTEDTVDGSPETSVSQVDSTNPDDADDGDDSFEVDEEALTTSSDSGTDDDADELVALDALFEESSTSTALLLPL